MVSSWLIGAGYEVIAASDGDQALQLAGEQRPDLLLVDVTMPGRDGYEVCRAIQAESATPPPVIFLTAHGQTNARVAGLDAGAVDYIVKPFANEELVARVRAALRTKAVHDGLAETRGARRADRPVQPSRARRPRRPGGRAGEAPRAARSRACCSTSTTSSRSTTPTVTPPATRSCARPRSGSATPRGSPTSSAATAARSSSCCCPRPTGDEAVVAADKLRALLAGSPGHRRRDQHRDPREHRRRRLERRMRTPTTSTRPRTRRSTAPRTWAATAPSSTSRAAPRPPVRGERHLERLHNPGCAACRPAGRTRTRARPCAPADGDRRISLYRQRGHEPVRAGGLIRKSHGERTRSMRR